MTDTSTHAQMLAALELAAKYLAKMVADNVDTVVPPSRALHVVEQAIKAGKAAAYRED